jgi:hypothetical protein
MEALTSRRSQSTRVGHTNSFRRRITRLDQSRSSASTQRHLTSATEHERAFTTRELALRAVAMGRRRSTQTGTPNDRGTTREFLLRRARPTVPRVPGASWSPPRATSRTRLRHRRSDEPCGRSSIVRPHGVRLGVTMRVHMVRNRPHGDGRSVLRTSGQPRVDSTTQVIVAGQRGVIMRGRRGSRYGPPARRRTRTSSVGRRARPRAHVDGHAEEALLSIVRLLARQAAREAFDQAVAESDRSVEEGRE